MSRPCDICGGTAGRPRPREEHPPLPSLAPWVEWLCRRCAGQRLEMRPGIAEPRDAAVSEGSSPAASQG
jgi:hypothetical protein